MKSVLKPVWVRQFDRISDSSPIVYLFSAVSSFLQLIQGDGSSPNLGISICIVFPISNKSACCSDLR